MWTLLNVTLPVVKWYSLLKFQLSAGSKISRLTSNTITFVPVNIDVVFCIFMFSLKAFFIMFWSSISSFCELHKRNLCEIDQSSFPLSFYGSFAVSKFPNTVAFENRSIACECAYQSLRLIRFYYRLSTIYVL